MIRSNQGSTRPSEPSSVAGRIRFKASVLLRGLTLVDERLQQAGNKEEENVMVDKAIGIYINDMIRHTMKVYTLSQSLSNRDPASAYNSIQDSLEKVYRPIIY